VFTPGYLLVFFMPCARFLLESKLKIRRFEMEKLIWMTGMSESGGNNYLENKFLPYCKKKRKKVAIIYLGRTLARLPGGIKINMKNVLNVGRDILDEKMLRVFNDFSEELSKYLSENDAVIVKTHKWFRFNSIYSTAHAASSVMKFDPQLFVTFIDGIGRIRNRLANNFQFRRQNFSKAEICDWQTIEVESTREMAELLGKPFFALPSGEPAELLYELIFNPDVEPSYVSVDITHSSKEVRQKVDTFIEEARKFLPCLINPYNFPLDYENRDDAEDSHVVNMCMNWVVPQSEVVIGYYPFDITEITSHGKPHELGKAFILGKDVWLVYIPKKGGPFEFHFTTEPIFKSEKVFFDFLKERKKLQYGGEI
jgi:hypothetical protein